MISGVARIAALKRSMISARSRSSVTCTNVVNSRPTALGETMARSASTTLSARSPFFRRRQAVGDRPTISPSVSPEWRLFSCKARRIRRSIASRGTCSFPVPFSRTLQDSCVECQNYAANRRRLAVFFLPTHATGAADGSQPFPDRRDGPRQRAAPLHAGERLCQRQGGRSYHHHRRQGHSHSGCQGQQLYRRFCRALLRQRRLWPRRSGRRHFETGASASLLPFLRRAYDGSTCHPVRPPCAHGTGQDEQGFLWHVRF